MEKSRLLLKYLLSAVIPPISTTELEHLAGHLALEGYSLQIASSCGCLLPYFVRKSQLIPSYVLLALGKEAVPAIKTAVQNCEVSVADYDLDLEFIFLRRVTEGTDYSLSEDDALQRTIKVVVGRLAIQAGGLPADVVDKQVGRLHIQIGGKFKLYIVNDLSAAIHVKKPLSKETVGLICVVSQQLVPGKRCFKYQVLDLDQFSTARQKQSRKARDKDRGLESVRRSARFQPEAILEGDRETVLIRD